MMPELLINLCIFAISLCGLIVASDKLLSLLSFLGRHWKISSAVLAFVVIAIGTSLPELTSSLVAVGLGDTELAIANLFGSNLTNSLLIGGLIVLFASPIFMDKAMLGKRNLMFVCAVVPVLLMVFASNMIATVGLFALGLFVIFYLVKSISGEDADVEPIVLIKSVLVLLLQTVFWLALMVVAGYFTVKSVESIGASLGLSATLLGVVFLAFGTSLPELVTSFIAIRRNEAKVAVATLFGSNVVNVTLLLGVTYAATPGTINIPQNLLYLAISAGVACLVLGFGLQAQKALRAPAALVFFALYGLGVYVSG